MRFRGRGTCQDAVEIKKLGDKLGDVDADAPVNRLTNTLAEVESETFGDRLSDLKGEALVVTLTNTLLDVEAQKLG